MDLLLKWLRPDVIPSPNRKKIPFFTRARLFLYRRCLLLLRKWYSKYAFSDTIIIVGRPSIRIHHEWRDMGFEAELKRMRISLPEALFERQGETSFHSEKRRARPFFKSFQFKDTFRLDMDGQKISIDHGQGRSFISTMRGHLKESDSTSPMGKYVFNATRREDRAGSVKVKTSLSESISDGKPSVRTAVPRTSAEAPRGRSVRPAKKSGSLFGDDPLFGKVPAEASIPPACKPTPVIRTLEGVTIDESF